LQKRPSRATYGRQGFLDPHKLPCYLTGWGTSTDYWCLYPSQSNNIKVLMDRESVDARERLIWIICGECAECAQFPLPGPTRTFNRTSRFESFLPLSGVRRKVTGFSWDLVVPSASTLGPNASAYPSWYRGYLPLSPAGSIEND
jgi:hypothetical protein